MKGRRFSGGPLGILTSFLSPSCRRPKCGTRKACRPNPMRLWNSPRGCHPPPPHRPQVRVRCLPRPQTLSDTLAARSRAQPAPALRSGSLSATASQLCASGVRRRSWAYPPSPVHGAATCSPACSPSPAAHRGGRAATGGGGTEPTQAAGHAQSCPRPGTTVALHLHAPSPSFPFGALRVRPVSSCPRPRAHGRGPCALLSSPLPAPRPGPCSPRITLRDEAPRHAEAG